MIAAQVAASLSAVAKLVANAIYFVMWLLPLDFLSLPDSDYAKHQATAVARGLLGICTLSKLARYLGKT